MVAATGLAVGVTTFAYASNGTRAVRHVRGRTVTSEEAPRVELSVPKGFRFVGTQQVNLYGNAEAEQFVFAKKGRDNSLESFYWMQFEHFLPSNAMTYNYDSMHPTQIGDLQFMCDVKSWPDLAAASTENPGSDVAAVERLLAQKHLPLPHATVLVRMFHLPSADHRTELMIIYGEAVPKNSAVPIRKEGVALDTEAPDLAQMFLRRATEGLAVHKQ
jgi:hypothetical protein